MGNVHGVLDQHLERRANEAGVWVAGYQGEGCL